MTKKSSLRSQSKRVTRSSSAGLIEDDDLLNTPRAKRSACKRICKQLTSLRVKPSCELIQERADQLKDVSPVKIPENTAITAPKILRGDKNSIKEYISINPALLADETIWDLDGLKSLCRQLELLSEDELLNAGRHKCLEVLTSYNVAPLDGGEQLFSKLIDLRIDGSPLKAKKPQKRVSILRTRAEPTATPKSMKRRSISFHPFNEVRVFNRESFPFVDDAPRIEPNPGILSNLFSFIASLKVLGVV